MILKIYLKKLIKMKKLKIFCVLLVIIALFVSCNCDKNNCSGNKCEKPKSNRITLKEISYFEGTGFVIIEIDGVEYISNSFRGGICPLVKSNNEVK
jgi:hypothetical protein